MALPSPTLTTTAGLQVAPSLRGLPYFERTQDWMFRVVAWDTPQTALQDATATQGLQLRVVEPKTASWATYVSELTGASDGTLVSKFENGTVLVDDGRWAVAQSYWGGGAPNWWGATQPGKVAVLFKGSLVSSARRAWLTTGSTFGFAVAGSGKIRIDKVNDSTGTRTTLLSGTNGWVDLTEGNYLADGFVYSTVSDFAGCRIEVFYVQTGAEPWGGLVVKAVPTASWPATATAKAALAAAAPVLSGGLFAYGTSPKFDTVGSAHVAASPLPFIVEAAVTDEPGSATRMTFEVPLVNGLLHDGHGWVYNRADDRTDPGYLELFDGGLLSTFVLRRKRLVQLQVALQSATPNWTPIFTGHVHDFSGNSDGKLTVECLSFETRMVEQYEQLPDRVSYMARGYRTVDFFDVEAPTQEPVYNIPAFDHWPLEWAVEELGVRAGIDPSCFRSDWTELTAAGTQTQIILPWNATPKRFRAESLSGTKVQLPRPVHYGNAGVAFTETRPFDDDYVFRVEPTKDLWARSRELTDKMGYTWRFNAAGQAVLSATNVPVLAHDFVPANVTAGAVTEVVNPAAYGAKYLRTTAGATVQATVRASRIDASFPRQYGLNPWTLSVARASAPGTAIYTATIAPSSGIAAALPKVYTLFDSPTTGAGMNASLVTLYSGDYDQYIVTLTCGAGEGLLDCLLCYAVDPDNTVLPTLSVADTAISVQARPQQDGTRNKVTIVGRRKGAVTDSDKFAEAQAPTEQEFVVANAVDVESITNPAASNYVGYLKQSVIYDDSITDDGFAQYLAQIYIYRQRTPQPGTNVQHPLLPVVQLGDPVAVADTKYDTTKDATRQYVRRVEHRIAQDRFTTTLDTSAWPEFPAYQPRTDINLADFDNKPVINLTIDYTSLAGYAIRNPRDGTQTVPAGAWGYTSYNWVNVVPDTYRVQYDGRSVQTAGDIKYLTLPNEAPWPPVPGTVQIRPSTVLMLPGTAATTTTAGLMLSGYLLESYPLRGRVASADLYPDWIVTDVTVQFKIGNVVAGVWAAVENSTSSAFFYTVTGNQIIVYRGVTPTNTYYEDVGLLEITIAYVSTGEDARKVWLSNSPYHQYLDVYYTDNPTRKLELPWKQAKGFGRSAYVTGYDVRYRPLHGQTVNDPNLLPAHAGTVTNGQPFSAFYDPYTSELGHVVTTSMDVLAEGLYRISVRSRHDDTIVAWLTNAQADAAEPEQHWEYMTIASQRTFTWDGVDQLGEWNAAQSELYEKLVGGAFNENAPARVGRGYYVWNREVAGAGLGPQAYIWMKRDGTTGKPIIGHGTYAAWYICVEVITDALATSNRQATVKSEGVVLTHLPEPTKLALKVEDLTFASAAGTGTVAVSNGVATFSQTQSLGTTKKIAADGKTFQVVSGAGTSWSVTPVDLTVAPGTSFTILTGSYSQKTTADWALAAFPSQETLGAYINSTKPVRVRFQVANRPGYLWEGQGEQVSVKLTREVHLRAVIGDQILKFAGKEFPGTTFEERTVYNRRLMNDEHTQQYQDSGFRRANSFRWNDGDAGVTEWVFYPQDFKSDFRISGLQESIAFGDYLQLEEVPSWSDKKDIAAPRARLQFALLSYLFYLSAFVTDRSGRSSWGINREFVDMSKIFDMTTGLDWPDDPMYQQRRTVVCRQWTDEDNWVYRQRTAFGYAQNTIFERLLQHWWYQHEITSANIGTTITPWSSFQLGQDYYSYNHRPSGGVNGQLRVPAEYSTNTYGYRQLGRVTGVSSGQPVVETMLNKNTSGTLVGGGSWSWETEPLWIPSITRDLHPYFLVPPMMVPPKDGSTAGYELKLNDRNVYTTTTADFNVKVRTRDGSEANRKDVAGAEVWSSGTAEMAALMNTPTSPSTSLVRWRPGRPITGTDDPFKNIFSGEDGSKIIAYVRQDETVHYEDLRGVYSRGKYPTAQPIKVAAGSAYYINQFKYYGVQVGDTLQRSLYPLFHVIESASGDVGLRLQWFRQAFRSEYVWESGSFYPATLQGAENLEAVLWWRTRYLQPSTVSTVYYDYGAWTGWKDDLPANSAVVGGIKLASGAISSPFITRHLPVGVGSVLKTTYELTAHLVLVPERRGST
jgi:hypothetical protein